MSFWLNVSTFWSNLIATIKTFPKSFWSNSLDVIVVALIVYYLLCLIRETRALQLFKSIGVILVVYLIANALSMISLKFFISQLINSGLIFLAVIFQPELRRAMEQIGRSKLTDLAGLTKPNASLHQQTERLIEALGESCGHFSDTRTGALIVIERETKLGDIISTGTIIDSEPSEALLGNLFFINSPLHDGALVVRDGRLHAAGCFLPLSDNYTISRELGTRHRAALGMSEVSDAIVIVVSEETGAISVAQNSKLQRGLSVKNLKMLLKAKLLDTSDSKRRRYFTRKGREQQ